MPTRVLLRLLAVLGLLLLLRGGLRFAERARSGDVEAGDLLLEAWDVNEVAAFDIEGADPGVSLARKSGRWVVKSHHGYWADFPAVAQALRALSEAKVGRVVPDGLEYLSEFGLDPQAETNRPLRLVFRDAQGAETRRVWLGAIQSRSSPSPWGGLPGGRFVRVNDGPVLLAGETLNEFRARSEDWIRSELVSVPASDVASVSVTKPGETPYSVQTTEAGAYQAADLTPDEETDPGAAGRLFGALQSLRCSRVADPARSDAELGLSEPGQFVLKTKDGVLYTVLVGGPADGEAGRHARITVSLDPPPAAPESEANERIQAVRETVTGWTFELPNDWVESMWLRRDEVVRPKPPPPPAPAPPAEDPDAEPAATRGKPAVSLDFLGEPLFPVSRPGPYRDAQTVVEPPGQLP